LSFFHSFGSPDVSHSIHCIIKFWSMSCFAVVPQCSREVSASRVSHPKYLASKPVSVHVHLIYQLHLYVCFMSLMGDTSRPSFDESIPVDFNTLSRNRLRNQLVLWDLHASMAGLLTFDSRFTSLTSDRMIPWMFDSQLIHSHSLECTRVPWESLTLMVISLALVNGLHH
jgi:hypothetical protein